MKGAYTMQKQESIDLTPIKVYSGVAKGISRLDQPE